MAEIFVSPPTPGMYWFKDTNGRVTIADVYANGDVYLPGVFETLTLDATDVTRHVKGTWIGPLVPPHELR